MSVLSGWLNLVWAHFLVINYKIPRWASQSSHDIRAWHAHHLGCILPAEPLWGRIWLCQTYRGISRSAQRHAAYATGHWFSPTLPWLRQVESPLQLQIRSSEIRGRVVKATTDTEEEETKTAGYIHVLRRDALSISTLWRFCFNISFLSFSCFARGGL